MDGCPVVSEQFLGPSAKLMAGSAVVSDFLDCVAIANPPKVCAPEIRCDAGEGPTAAGDFADEGMIVGFGGRATTRAGVHGLKSGGGEGRIKGYGGRVARLEEGGGGGCSFRIFRLHEDERHSGFGPICLDEYRKSTIVSAEEGVGKELGLEIVEKGV